MTIRDFNWKQVFISIRPVNKDNIIDKLKEELLNEVLKQDAVLELEKNNKLGEAERDPRLLNKWYKEWQDNNFDINFIFRCGTLACIAAITDNEDLMDILIEAGADINTVNSTSVYFAALCNNAKAAEALIKAGAKADTEDIDGETPLHVFSRYGQAEIINFLIANASNKEAYVNAVDKYKHTALHISAIVNVEVAETLIKAGAKVDTEDINGQTPLHLVSRYGQARIITNLMDNASDKEAYINAVDKDKRAALHISAIHNNVDVAKTLIKAGAKVDTEDINGRTPLHLFSIHDQARIITDLIDNASDKEAYINAVDMDKCTAFHAAVMHKRIDVIKVLIARGADPTLKTQYSKRSMEDFEDNLKEELNREIREDSVYAMLGMFLSAPIVPLLGPLAPIGLCCVVAATAVGMCVDKTIQEITRTRKLKQKLEEFKAKNNKTPIELADSEEIRKLIDTERKKYLDSLREQASSISPATIIETTEIHAQKEREERGSNIPGRTFQ